MSKQEVLSTLKELNIPNDAYIVTMGAVLAVNNKREAGDIDVIFDPRIEPLLRAQGFVLCPTCTERQYATRYVKGNIEAFTCFFNVGTFKECLKTYTREFINDIPFMGLEDTLRVKSLFGREKDLRDLATV